MCVWRAGGDSRVSGGGGYVQTVMNAIKNEQLMERFFDSQKVEERGVYYVKVHHTQTRMWKYVIVDDYVPVEVQGGKVVRPLFLDVEVDNNCVEIWPFLIEKAYAKYYSTYDSLGKGNVLDFLEEVTGNFYQTLHWN